MIKKTWVIPHKAAEKFGWTFLSSFDAFKRVRSQNANKRKRTFLKSTFNCGGTLEGKKNLLFKYLRMTN